MTIKFCAVHCIEGSKVLIFTKDISTHHNLNQKYHTFTRPYDRRLVKII